VRAGHRLATAAELARRGAECRALLRLTCPHPLRGRPCCGPAQELPPPPRRRPSPPRRQPHRHRLLRHRRLRAAGQRQARQHAMLSVLRVLTHSARTHALSPWRRLLRRRSHQRRRDAPPALSRQPPAHHSRICVTTKRGAHVKNRVLASARALYYT
jgi:hypothetical protein